MFHHSGIVLESAKRRASLDASPRKASMFTDTCPNSTTYCWQIWYFVLIEREVRPHPDLTPVTSRRQALTPSLTLSISLRPSSHASVSSPSEYISIVYNLP